MPSPPAEIVRFQDVFRAIAQGADDLAFRRHGYRLLMGTDLGAPPARRFETWAAVAAAIEELAAAVPPLDPHTGAYVGGMLRALHTFARVRDGAALSYLEQVAAYLELDDVAVPEEELDAIRERIVGRLRDLGYPADLAAGLRAWEQARAVPSDSVAAVAEPLVEASKRAAIARGVPVPPTTAVGVAVRPSPYYAYAHYHGGYRGTVELTSDLLWTREAIKHSVCHEAFPGHQASAAAKEAAVADGRWGPVVLPSLANTPVSPVVEGLAEAGIDILGWRQTPDDDLFADINDLAFGARTNAAIMCHQEGAPRERVVAYLIERVGAREDWASYQYGFITDPLWHTSFPHYWHGKRLVRAGLDRFQGREPALFDALYARPQTTSTLRQLLAEDAEVVG